MEQEDFKMMVRVMMNRDKHEFGDLFDGADAVDPDGHSGWMAFRNDPPRWFIHNSGEMADAVWKVCNDSFTD